MAVLGFNILTTVVVILGNVLLFIFLPIIAKSEKFHRRSSLETVSAQRLVCVRAVGSTAHRSAGCTGEVQPAVVLKSRSGCSCSIYVQIYRYIYNRAAMVCVAGDHDPAVPLPDPQHARRMPHHVGQRLGQLVCAGTNS
jgi:hypothetical protein